MATGMGADDSRATSEAALSKIDAGNNDLCRLCLQALTINDHAAGGTAQNNQCDGQTTWDLAGLISDWSERTSRWEYSQKEFFDDRKAPDGACGRTRKTTWDLTGLMHDWSKRKSRRKYRQKQFLDERKAPNDTFRRTEPRRFCAGDQQERLVTLPRILEISKSAVGTCRLCLTIRDLFIEQYAKHSWWNQPGSTLRFTIQYEWCVRYGKVNFEDIPRSYTECLDGLGVLVTRPGLERYDKEIYHFDVVAWPGASYSVTRLKTSAQLFVSSGPCQEWLRIDLTPLDPGGPASNQNIRFMKRCIDTCMTNHPRCKNKILKPKFVPRRLLDIGDHHTISARLIECDENAFVRHLETQLEYATLSYCWGGSPAMITTAANKCKYETTGIDIHNMPPTFQDAIYVVKNLGIRYLWIDALCIIQDDKNDWEAESVTMADIFAHSKVTICAAKCSSSAEHFLQRPADKLLTLHFQSKRRPDISGQYSIRLEPQHEYPALQDLEKSVWLSRAWVWQEQVMSARQLVFGNKTLQFRCGAGTLLEDGRQEVKNDPKLEVPSYPASSWKSTVCTYSWRTLTYPSDRLKAVAGVAKFIEDYYFKGRTEPNYLVGLWKYDEFEAQLRWVCTQPTLSRTELLGHLRDEERYIAPSWSWASRNTGIGYIRRGHPTAFQVIKWDLQPSHKSTMVSVAFGSSITVSGKLRQTPVEPSNGRYITDRIQWGPRWEASSDYGCTEFWLDWVPKSNDVEESRFQSQLYLLLIGMSVEFEWKDKSHRDGKAAVGLIIAPAIDPGTESIFYYRVGVFEHRGDTQILTNAPEQEVMIR